MENMKKKVLVFTGAGVSAESGVETFRTDENGLWYKHKVEDVATFDGWRRDREKVLNFYNERRKQLKTVEPNLAHKIITELEKDFDVTVVTQNVDNLHERSGSTKVIHLHGELTKVRSTLDPNLIYDWEDDVNIGDKCEKGSQLRPHVIWFGEQLDSDKIEMATQAAIDCDFCIIVGTSMQVFPANQIPFLTKPNTLIYIVDPSDMDFYVDKQRKPFITYIKEVASIGMEKVRKELKDILLNDVTNN
jgi:NAD-dependent deacetylase